MKSDGPYFYSWDDVLLFKAGTYEGWLAMSYAKQCTKDVKYKR